MKSIVILIALAALGIVPAAHAQSDNPAATQAPAAQAPSSGSASGSVSTPSGEVKGQVDVDRKSEARPPARTDSSRDDGAYAMWRLDWTKRKRLATYAPSV